MTNKASLVELEAEKRVKAVAELNGAEGNMAIARERLAKATAAVAAVEGRHEETCRAYGEARAQVLRPDIGASARIDMLEKVNAHLSAMHADAQERQRAKSEQGVARSEMERFENDVLLARTALVKLLPDV